VSERSGARVTARDAALAALDTVDAPDWPAKALRRSVRTENLPPRDAHLACRIEIAALKNLLLVNHLIEHYADRPLKKIDSLVRKVLGVALAQILFLDRIPSSAAVDEAVKQARKFGKGSAAGFVNAVLRRSLREPRPMLPDRAADPREYARLALSHPPELFDRLVDLLGTEDALRFAEHDNASPPTILRLAPGVTLEQLQSDKDVTLTPHEHPGMMVMHPTRSDLLSRWSRQGLAQAQDPSSADVVEHCDVCPGMRVLDRCCGLGTKTLQIREKVGDAGTIVAVDPNERRTQQLRELLSSRGISSIGVVQAAWLRDVKELVPPGGFDRVLVDAPCSNSGVLARRAAARYRQYDATLASLRKLQLDILADTAPHVAPGGLMVYATCSVWPEENQGVVQQFLTEHREYEQVSGRTILPSLGINRRATQYHDGSFVAVLRKHV
jgi:16S rRNA (cytosine967-C5)-methyltransferase